MKKPLAGYRAFKAMGFKYGVLRIDLKVGRSQRLAWPDWAFDAFNKGWLEGANSRIYDELVAVGKVLPRSRRVRHYSE
jgi:hypothetical protein